MAVSTKTTRFLDRSGRPIDVHHISVNKGNRKGTASLVFGDLKEDEDDWYIGITTTVNGRRRRIHIQNGDIVFKTGKSKRWQVLSKKEFSKRFAVIK